MQHVTDLFNDPFADGIALAHVVMREMRVQTLHTIARSAPDRTCPFQYMQRVAFSDVRIARGVEARTEVVIRRQQIGDLLHPPGRFESANRDRCTPARQPVQRRERRAVRDRVRLDHRRQSAWTPDRHANLSTQTATELSLDRRPVDL